MTDGAEPVLTNNDDAPARSQLITLFWLAAVASVVLPRIPYGRNLLYPFALLGTWAHEMGHGVMAVLLGGSFERLEIYRSLGGVAFFAGVGSFGTVLVSAAGLLGPAIAGALVIVYGSRPRTARWVLLALGIVVALSVLLVVRNGFGILALSLIGAALVAIGVRWPGTVGLAATQLIGVQLCLASWGTLDYMFTKNFTRGGQTVDSDSQNIADVLLLPYWFWGGLIAALSVAILAFAFYRAWIHPYRSSSVAPTT